MPRRSTCTTCTITASPEVSRAEGNLHFTVVRGGVLGDFVPHTAGE
ncbi:MAG: hypothetical protein ACREHD_08505 [Pirellulales bacterium]